MSNEYNNYLNLDNLDCIYAPLYAADCRLKFQMNNDGRQQIFSSIVNKLDAEELKKMLLDGCNVKLFRDKIIPALQKEIGDKLQIYALDGGCFPGIRNDYTLKMCLDVARQSVVVFSYKDENRKFWACIDDVSDTNIIIFGSSASRLAIDDCSFKNDAKYHIVRSSLFVFMR